MKKSVLKITILLGIVVMVGLPSSAEDQLPQPSTGSPSSQALPTSTSEQPGDVTLTPENPVSSNPLPAIPKLELNTPEQASPVLPPLPNNVNALFEPQIYVKQFVFTGNTVYDSDTLAAIVITYTGRKITSDELEAARQAITLYYVNHGYINSGALLPDQDPKDGIIHMQIVEGKLTSVDITGNHWFQSWWLRNEMRQAGGEPLNFNSLKEGMQVLRENPTISQVNAELQPGGAPGESQLKMEVKDNQPFRFSIEVNNYRPPSVGSTIAEAHFADLNLTGNNDPLTLTYGIVTSTPGGWEVSGFDNAGADYRFPISPWRTTMEIGADKSNSGILEAPFNQLDIVSKLVEYHAAIHQPVFETPKHSLVLSLQLDSRRSETSLFGQPFSLSPGANNGVEDVFVPRFVQEFVDRSQVHVLSVRSQFSYGLAAGRATINPTGPPDGHFFDWLGQTQYIRRLGDSDCLVIGRLSGQISDRPLLSIEQIELGGISSVRGYLENQVLSDNGILASLEFRIPVLEDKDKNSIISLAPFSDFGLGWDDVDPNSGTTSNLGRQGVTMPSVGLGLLVNPIKYVSGQIYYGYGFNSRQTPHGDSLQNQGIEFSVTINAL